MTFVLPLARTIVLTDNGTAPFSAKLAAYDGTPIGLPLPPALPSFARLPAITTDGSPTVGEIVSLDFGAILYDAIGACQILRADGSVVATVTTGSYQLADAGQIKLRVYAAATIGLYAETPLLTIEAIADVATPAPGLAFPTSNADGSAYATSTNPPVVLLTIPEELTKTKYRALVYYDQLASGPLSIDPARTIVIEDLMAAADAEEFVVSGFAGLVGGKFRTAGLFQGIETGTKGPLSDLLIATLDAPALPPATTTWSSDSNLKSVYVTLLDNDRVARGRPDVGQYSWQCFAANALRSDKRYFEIGLEERSENDGANCIWGGGLMGAADTVPSYRLPTEPDNYAFGLPASVEVGTRILFMVTPASADGTMDGLVVAYNGGVELDRKSHPYKTYRAYGLTDKNTKTKFYAGQEAFQNAAVIADHPDFKRYN